QEIIGRPPHWLIRGGIAAFLGMLLLLFAAANTIEYPEVIETKIKLKMEGTPATVISEVEGILISLNVENGSHVRTGQVLAEMSSGKDLETLKEITAPRSGTLFYVGIIEEEQRITGHRELFYIRPENASYYGEITIPESSFGKIEEGQTVLVHFNGYPSQEYGSVKARIDYFPKVMTGEGVFTAKANFSNGLATNYGHQLTPIEGMTGQAEIITKEMKLLDRIYYNLAGNIR
ncbi:MAG: HlyD family efflux transporter periplasmic adaptor subunit, partial [Balneolaceae bacterium]|nr:HlyD family efflux transporter periplasmic adaptor subunit [Balneolaceae bacterium]